MKMKRSLWGKRLKSTAVSLAAVCSLALTSFPLPVRAAGTESESVTEAKDRYLTEFPENKEIPLTNIKIPYEDVCYIYKEKPVKYMVLPGDTVVFTPEKIELTEIKGYYGQKVMTGSGLVNFLPNHDPDDTYIPDKVLTEDSFIDGETYQVGSVDSNGPIYDTSQIPEQSEVSGKTAKVGFVNNSDAIICFEGSAGYGPFDKLEVFDISGGAPATVLQIFYRQHSMEYRYLEAEHDLNYSLGESGATWQGSEALLPKKFAYRNDIDKYTLYFPCPVAEGKHFERYSETPDEQYGWWAPVYASVYDDNAYSVKGQRMIAYQYEFQLDGSMYNHGGCTLEAVFSDGETVTIDGNGGTVDGQAKWIAEVDSVEGDQRYAYAGTTHAIDPDGDFNVVRDGYTVSGWYYMNDLDGDGTYNRHPFYGFGDDRSYYEKSDDSDSYGFINWNIFPDDNALKLYPVWVDAEGNYSDPNTGLTTPLEEVVIPKEEEPTSEEPSSEEPSSEETTSEEPTEDDPTEEVVRSRDISYETIYDTVSCEDGFIAIATYTYSVNGVEVPDAKLEFIPADDKALAELEAKGIHLGDPRIAAAGYDADVVAAFVDYDGAWKESSFLTYQIGTWYDEGGFGNLNASINMPQKRFGWVTENSATGEGAVPNGEFLILFEDYFYNDAAYKAYIYDELSTSGKSEVEKTLTDNETPIACFTSMLMLDKGSGAKLVDDKEIWLYYTPDPDSFERYDEYKWYELKSYKKAGSYEPEFSSAGIGAKVNGTGTYLLVGIRDDQTKDISKATVSGLKTVAYTGKAITPAVTVKLDGKTLKKGTDYEVTYAKNKEPGSATVTITGKGDYSGTITKKFLIKKVSFKYRAYVQKKNWMAWSTAKVSGTSESAMAGTTDNLRMETIQMQLSGVSGEIKYRAYVEKMGWTQWATTADTKTYAGTKGLSRRVEMIQLTASGQVATLYDMYYRAYSEKFGWLGWAKSGEKAGSAGYARKLEAFQVNFVRKGESFKLTSDRAKCFYDKTKDGANPK